MTSADPVTRSAGPALRRTGPAPRRAGAWFGALGLATVVPVLPLWLFCTDPGSRRTAILVLLGCALACIGGIAAFQRAAGGRQSYAAIALAEFAAPSEPGEPAAPEPKEPPRALPSRRGMTTRSLAWYVGLALLW
ncbi:hypothetical protein GTY65_36465 [Streptomyces sp. SID8379]|uniref:hypothetical protein n=1 Tax=unclassified Streptomyces TaxID=2593676 RepID=UPI00036A57DE|nr:MULTISPECIES: hypothetical protein [unclassified Streptomyces]MYW69522.1 hypothetical protein [Streptomyces sp. SID8379]